jgi:hypothetical protein
VTKRYLTWVLAASLVWFSSAAWSSGEAEQGQKSEQRNSSQRNPDQQQRRRRQPKRLMLMFGEGAVARLWKPDLTAELLEIERGSIALPATGMGNYHALVVEQDWGNSKDFLIRYEYMRGKESGFSPSKLANAQKAPLEIIPDPIPREHYRYLSGSQWNFLVRYQGEAVADLPVMLETEFGSRLESKTDPQGRVSFQFPDDFPEVKPGRRNNSPAELWLTANYGDGEINYQTRLSAPYHVNPAHWQSTGLAAAVFAFGLLAGGVIGRVRSDKKGETS